MYKLLLAWRYLRTRFIALASIVSVTLGVATLIVVNSVMSGFISEMHARLHGILSDVEIAPPGLDVMYEPQWHAGEIRKVLGDDIDEMTQVVRVPGLLNFQFRGRPMTQQVVLIGIDDASYGRVTDFHPYLKNVNHRSSIDFLLHEDGYDPELGQCGWPYRRAMAEAERRYREQFEQLRRQTTDAAAGLQEVGPEPEAADPGASACPADKASRHVQFTPLPAGPPPAFSDLNREGTKSGPAPPAEPPTDGSAALAQMAPTDPFAAFRQAISPDDVFDPGRDQHTGIVLGMAIASRQMHDAETGQPSEIFLIRPGDDVEITLPSAGPNPTPISENCTVVDLYESRMHEYDSMFAFLPLSRLQALRGMIDPLTGQTSISAIHIKLRPGADLDQARDRLIAHFPPDRFGYVIQTWQDTQRPLLSAVELEVTILNILLFLIIAVAGFGILATFFMIVVEKTRDIGILKSLGATSRGVASIFLGYGFSLGSVGTGVGIGLGLLIVAHINDIADALQRWTGREVFDPEIYYFNEIPAAVDVWTVACVAGGAILIAVLASVLPSIRAARLHPVEALRYE